MKFLGHILLVGLLGATSVACSGDDSGGGASNSGGSHTGTGGLGGEASTGGNSSGGSDTSGGTGGTGGGSSIVAASCGPAASTNADGILTSYPNIHVTMASAGYKLTTMNFDVIEDGDSRGPLLKFMAELQNTGDSMGCQFLPDVSLDFNDVVTLADGPAYHLQIGSTVFTTIDTCINPGETAILYGVARGITKDDLAKATSLTVDPSPSNYPGDVYQPAIEPVLSGKAVKTADGYAVSGDITYVESIYNQAVYVYPRDARGLIVDKLVAYPGDLGDHFSGSTATFETESTKCAFTDFEVYQSWITKD